MNKYIVLNATLVVLSGILGNAASAADAGVMDEVSVTATKTEAGLSNTPAAVTVVNANDIETKKVSHPGHKALI